MTRDDIIRWAREAGLFDLLADGVIQDHEIQRFAELVAAAEREACAQVCADEICSCCWADDAQAAAEHIADTIRARSAT